MSEASKPVESLMLWGLDADAQSLVFEHFERDRVILLDGPPGSFPDTLLVVGIRAFSQYLAWAEQYENQNDERTGDRPSPVLLFVPNGVEEPEEWDYYDGILRYNDREVFLTLLACREVINARLAAIDVSSTFLSELRWPVSTVPASDFPFANPGWQPVDSPLRRHLGGCLPCRRAFNAVLDKRLSIIGGLASDVAQVPNSAHIIDAMPSRYWRTWLGVPVDASRLLAMTSEDRRQEIAVLALLGGMTRDRSIEPRFDYVLRGDDVLTDIISNFAGSEEEADSLVSKLEDESGLVFRSNIHSIRIRLQNEYMILDRLRMLNVKPSNEVVPVREFRLEIRQGEKLLKGWESVDGSMNVLLEELETNLAGGPVDFLLLRIAESL